MMSGFVLHTRTVALPNLRVRTAGVRAAYGAVRADYFKVVGPPGSRNNPLQMRHLGRLAQPSGRGGHQGN